MTKVKTKLNQALGEFSDWMHSRRNLLIATLGLYSFLGILYFFAQQRDEHVEIFSSIWFALASIGWFWLLGMIFILSVGAKTSQSLSSSKAWAKWSIQFTRKRVCRLFDLIWMLVAIIGAIGVATNYAERRYEELVQRCSNFAYTARKDFQATVIQAVKALSRETLQNLPLRGNGLQG